MEQRVEIVNPSGLHARPAAQVVEFAKTFPGRVEVLAGQRRASLKSILMLLELGLCQGTQVLLQVEGEGEEAFLQQLAGFIENLKG
ncbi:HPr family phosphocarrier protein [Ruminococcaceae bacterium OttesenSCG-928-O06]|nr:HPr family phosphocarrier protein [Ruminococcaceae bacterium OttesenSCG-928-O06]